MRSKNDTWTIARQMAFYAPADMRGKWHAAWKVTHTPVCGSPVTLSQFQAIHAVAGQDSAQVHPFACRRCLRLSTPAGVTASGMEQ